jgi:hypothetical protein
MKWRVLAVRSADSVCGPGKRYCSCDGNELRWNTKAGAQAYADNYNGVNPNLEYFVEPIDGRNNSMSIEGN